MRKPTKFSLEAIVLVFVSSVTYAYEAVDDTVPAGRYLIESQMVLPHMEEMRRIHKRVEACIAEGDVARLFPVFHQPALTGCVLSPAQRDGETAHYLLECAGVNGASGNASLSLDGKHISGALVAKMGGKNMTFSQFVKAQWRESCVPQSYAPKNKPAN